LQRIDEASDYSGAQHDQEYVAQNPHVVNSSSEYESGESEESESSQEESQVSSA